MEGGGGGGGGSLESKFINNLIRFPVRISSFVDASISGHILSSVSTLALLHTTNLDATRERVFMWSTVRRCIRSNETWVQQSGMSGSGGTRRVGAVFQRLTYYVEHRCCCVWFRNSQVTNNPTSPAERPFLAQRVLGELVPHRTPFGWACLQITCYRHRDVAVIYIQGVTKILASETYRREGLQEDNPAYKIGRRVFFVWSNASCTTAAGSEVGASFCPG